MALTLAGCSVWHPTTVPMRVLRAPAACADRPDTLLVMLPGSFDEPEDFVKQGFVAAVRDRRLKVDLAIVDAHVGYYAEKSILDRLQADVVGPARANGYTHIWLAGISIGAFGAMLFAEAHADGSSGNNGSSGVDGNDGIDGIDGVAVLGPYIGSRLTTNEIERAGGLARWTPPAGPLTLDDADLRVWRWLKPLAEQPAGTSPAPPRVPLYLAYGLGDRFERSDALLAAALPPERVFTTDGGHDWTTWRALWPRLLDAMPLPRDAGCASASGAADTTEMTGITGATTAINATGTTGTTGTTSAAHAPHLTPATRAPDGTDAISAIRR